MIRDPSAPLRKASASRLNAALVTALCVILVSAANLPAQDGQPAALDDVSRQAAKLEADLGKYSDTAPEAADAMVQLADLYHAHARVFGLIRVAQRFVANHAGDPRHKAVMLKLMDGLESVSRNKDMAVACRQLLARYPDAPEAAEVEVRLARTLDQLDDIVATANAYRAVWQRQPGTKIGREHGVGAIGRFSQVNNKNVFIQAAQLGEEMLDKLPPGRYATEAGLQGFHQYRRGAEWAKSNVVGAKLLAKGLPADKDALRELHYYMAENHGNLGQHANAVESLRKVRELRDDNPAHHLLMIVRMHHAAMKSDVMEPVVNEYIQKYPERDDRHQTKSYLAHSYLRAENKPRAVQLLAEVLPFDAVTNANASAYLRENGAEPPQLAESERVLLAALQQNKPHAYSLRYTLAFELYRDRLKDPAKTRQMLHEQVAQSPTNDHHSWYAIDWLLTNAENDAEFHAEVARIIAARKEHLHLTTFRNYLNQWIQNVKNNKDLKDRVAYVQAELKKANDDPLVSLWLQNVDDRNRSGEAARKQILEGPLFASLNDQLAMAVLRAQGEFYWSYGGNNTRPLAAGVYATMAKRFPKDYQAALWYLQTAVDYNPPEVQKEAALHLLSLEPQWQTPDIWYRLMVAADRNNDPELVKRAFAWILKSQEKFGKDPTYASSYMGDLLAKHKFEQEALEYWKTYVSYNRNHYESRECAWRLLTRMEDPAQKIAFLQELLQHDTDFHGRYAMWLAGEHLAAGDFANFEKVMRDARARQDERPFRNWDVEPWTVYQWVEGVRPSKEISDENKQRVYAVVRDLEVGWPSGVATVAHLESQPQAEGTEPTIARLLAYQEATRRMGNDSHDWDRLMPYAQAVLARKDYVVSATLLTGMLSNITNAEATRKQAGREMVAQSYARMGAVGLTIDENSPLKPLLEAALYLRLGDEALALETYTANKALFNEHRHEVPVDLLVFVCESHIAAGGDENHGFVEDVLRTWQVKNNASAHIEAPLKAQVQLLLAKNFFKAQRYDLARTEFTTTLNLYPGSVQAVEAEFGIGETFMSQKVYDQAEAVFEKLAASHTADIVVRAEFLRGVLAHRRGDRDEARDIFRAVLERVPNVELANQALFNLAEVYGAEERYIDQLNLLRTVGRLGRASKRFHAPGMPLSIVVQDSDLGISRGHNRIPVRVRTEPGGDSELIYLTSGGAGKGLFRADLETGLGQPVADDRILQLSGRDIIQCDYPDEFKAEFKNVPLSDVEIRIASDAQFKLASSKIIDEEEESFSERLQREEAEAENADRRVSQSRPANQIKPGNLVYLRVEDADRDLTSEVDQVVVKLTADSGDQVQVPLKETGPHTGIFEGTAQTAELPAGALASDTSIDHSPLMAIDKDPNTYWLSEPDGATPKFLTVDMKDLKLVSRVTISTPQADQHAPVRGSLYGSNDGLFWFRLASHPELPPAEPVAGEYGPMQRRLYAGNFTGYSDWNQVVALTKNAKPIEEELVQELSWQRLEEAEDAKNPFATVWHGKLVQEREGAARIAVQGVRTAVMIDGRLELPLGPGGRTVDVWLESGAHDLTIFAATTNAVQGLHSTWARSDHNATQVTLQPFRASDFDLDQPAAANRRGPGAGAGAGDAQAAAPPAPQALAVVGDRTWEFRVPPMELRHVRFVVDEYLGEALAINNIEIGGEEPDQLYIPTGTDVLSLATNDLLEIAGGDTVTAAYTDEFTQSDSGQSRLLTGRLDATYFNAQVSPIAYEFVKQPNGAVVTERKQLMRIDPGERIVLEIVDYDQDQTDERDTLRFQVFVNDGEPLDFVATETEEYSGIFTKEIDTSAKSEEGKLQVRSGDRIYCRYIDSQNTFPGHAVPREAVVYVNQPSLGRVRILETRLVPPPPGSNAPPQIVYRAPERRAGFQPAGNQPAEQDQPITGVAFEAPLTVEVIDPDAAKDSRSSVVVKLVTSDGAQVDVRCVVSDMFVPGRQPGLDYWALREGRFIGQVVLQLGGKNSQATVPLTSEMPRNLVGGPAVDEDDAQSALNRTLIARVLNLSGKDVITAAYRDELRPSSPPANLLAKGRLITNGQLAVADRDYDKEVTQLHVGEKLFLKVTDADRDTSDERDWVAVEIATELGEKETVQLEETLAHSGLFTGSFALKPSDQPAPGNLKADDPIIETYFGDTVRVRYLDTAASTESGELEVVREIPVVIGTDGLVSAFSKTFNDEKLAVETKFHIAESYFELFKSHRNLGRKLEEKLDLEAGRRVLREVMEDYPDPKYVPRIAYLLGQFAQELQQWAEAIDSYETIVQRYADHTLAADAQYKLAQCYEEAGNFDQALEAYVTLAATYPKSPLIANVMIRISDHFYKSENYDVAAQVGEKFLERFETHQHASRMAFRVGQCYFKAKTYPKAGDAFDRFSKQFPDDVLCADALFWSGESFRMARNNQQAFRRYNRCRWDFPESDAAKYARGRLALPEMLAQFEAEANSIDDN